MPVDNRRQIGFPAAALSGQACHRHLVTDPEARVPGEDQVRQRAEGEIVPVEQLEHHTMTDLEFFRRQPGYEHLGQVLRIQVL